MYYKVVGDHQAVADLSGAVEITIPADATGILGQALAQNVRIKLGDQVPTATSGFQIEAGAPVQYIPMSPGSIFQVIEETASANFQWQAVKIKNVAF